MLSPQMPCSTIEWGGASIPLVFTVNIGTFVTKHNQCSTVHLHHGKINETIEDGNEKTM